MHLRVLLISILTAVVASHPAFAKEAGGQPVVTAQAPVVLWSSAAHASGKELSAATFELPAGTSCHVAEAHKAAPLWSCTLGGLTVSGFAQQAAFTKQGIPRAEPKSAFWARLRRYSGEWVKCMDPSPSPERCGQVLALRLNLFWATRSAEAPTSGAQTIQCPPNPVTPECVGNGCKGGCFSQHLGEGQLIGGSQGAVFLQQADKDTTRMFAATSEQAEDGSSRAAIAPPMSLRDPMLGSLLRVVDRTGNLEISVDLGRKKGAFLESRGRSSRLRTPLRLDGSRPFVVCDRQIARPTLARPARVEFEEHLLSDQLFPIYEYALPCASSLIIGEQVPGIRAGAKPAERFGTPPRMKAAPDKDSLSVGALSLRGELGAGVPETIRRCTFEFEGSPGGSSRSCRAVYAGDLNGDGKEDFVLNLRGESGCGGFTLFLSSPEGWKRAAENSDYC